MLVESSPENIRRAAELLRSGELVAFPTETVYGLGANGLDRSAVGKIFAAKGRPSNNPLILHIGNFEQISEVSTISPEDKHFDLAKRLVDEFWPGPLTLVVPKHDRVPSEVTAGLDTVAVRVPDNPIALELIKAFGGPLAAPSANLSSGVSPTEASHVAEDLGQAVAMIIDGGPTRFGIESTVLDLSSKTPSVLRPGGISKEELQSVVGDALIISACAQTEPANAPKLSPGRLSKHYAPRTPLKLRTEVEISTLPPRSGYIRFSPEQNEVGEPKWVRTKTLSENGDLREVATRLFSTIREFDRSGLDLIVVDTCSLSGIGTAIMDRLNRARG